MTHRLKTRRVPFQAILEGRKTHEVRSTRDQTFKEADVLILCEYDSKAKTYSGREIAVEVRYITPGGAHGLPDDLCVMSIAKV